MSQTQKWTLKQILWQMDTAVLCASHTGNAPLATQTPQDLPVEVKSPSLGGFSNVWAWQCWVWRDFPTLCGAALSTGDPHSTLVCCSGRVRQCFPLSAVSTPQEKGKWWAPSLWCTNTQQHKDLLSHTRVGQQGHPSCHLAAIFVVLAESFLISLLLLFAQEAPLISRVTQGEPPKGEPHSCCPFHSPPSPSLLICPSRKPKYQFRKVPPRARPFQLSKTKICSILVHAQQRFLPPKASAGDSKALTHLSPWPGCSCQWHTPGTAEFPPLGANPWPSEQHLQCLWKKTPVLHHKDSISSAQGMQWTHKKAKGGQKVWMLLASTF